jgi:hypothetical protein
MKNIELFINGSFYPGLTVGLTKSEIGKLSGQQLESPDFQTPDVDHYIVKMKTGIVLSMIFDKEDICFDISLRIKENEELNEAISFEDLIAKLNVAWEFDKKKTYLQTICIRLNNGLRLYYAFGNKDDNDYGLFSIRSILETHKFNL